ncbi:hypothetical protein [Paenibacillus sedimenti]|uniref:Uncharacterized protein n=1 Tax=Paenibacillus sedimenti TaxID=2770274 RepID=A0A926KPM0_9BACL|nr:hypothetical protein [Paenibacillus sedimenti]MBD0380616.1 hypothetical protein [Paenibacillus sedimenti]
MPSDQEHQSYEQLFIRFSAKVEKIIIRLMLVFFVLLISSQALLQIPYVRNHFTRVEPLEGKPYSQPQDSSRERS